MVRYVLIFIWLWSASIYAQNGVTRPPAVTIDELSESLHPNDSSAVAAYKYRYGKTWFERTNGGTWIMVTEVYTRIKVYKKAGLGYSNSQIMYYSDTRKAKGSFSDANTYNLVNGAIEKTPLKKEGQFEEEAEEDFMVKKIAMPNVKEGSIIEYTYTLRTPYFLSIEDWYFQFTIPADEVWYELYIPTYFKFNVYTTGFVPIEKGLTAYNQNEKTNVSEQYYTYKAKNVKAIRNEKYVTNIDNYTSSIKHELSSVYVPGMPLQRLSTNWNNIANEIYKRDKFGKELELASYYRHDLDLLLKPGYTQRQKTDSIYKFVRNRMAWDKYVGFFCRKGVEKAYADKTGNAAEINLMLTSMLRYAGLDANPVLASTRSHGSALFPTPFAFNYVISSVSVDGKIILLDATSKYSLPGILPERVLNWNGQMVKKGKGTVEVNLMPSINSHETVSVVAAIDADGNVAGRARYLHMEYIGHILREMFAVIPKDDYVEKLEATNKGTVISNYKMLNDNDPDKVLTEEFDYVNTMLADNVGGKIYFSPMLLFGENENPFLSETRDYPIDFIYPFQKKFNINISLPQGYEVESFPRNMSLAMKDNIGKFRYNLNTSANGIQLSAVFEINFSVVPVEYYKEIREFFRQMIEKQNEKVVLVKTNNPK